MKCSVQPFTSTYKRLVRRAFLFEAINPLITKTLHRKYIIMVIVKWLSIFKTFRIGRTSKLFVEGAEMRGFKGLSGVI